MTWKVTLNRGRHAIFQNKNKMIAYDCTLKWTEHVWLVQSNAMLETLFKLSVKPAFHLVTDLGSRGCSDVPLAINSLASRSFAFLHNLYRLHNAFRAAHLKLTH